MTTVLTGIYRDIADADAAVTRLVADGIDRHAISVIVKSTPDHDRLVVQETDDKPRGVLTGAITGGVLASMAFATLALPGIGILAAGPVVAALTAGSAGAVAGGIIGLITGHGVSTMVAQEYEAAVGCGQVLVAVHAHHEQARRVKQSLTASGAAHLSDAVHFSHEQEAGGDG